MVFLRLVFLCWLPECTNSGEAMNNIMRFVLTAQAFLVILKLGRPAAQTLGRYKAENNFINLQNYYHL